MNFPISSSLTSSCNAKYRTPARVARTMSARNSLVTKSPVTSPDTTETRARDDLGAKLEAPRRIAGIQGSGIHAGIQGNQGFCSD
jgi:hypothetical protein